MVKNTVHLRDLAEYFRRSKQFYYFISDLDGNYLYANPLFLEAVDPELKKLDGIAVTDTISRSGREAFENAIKQCIADPDTVVMAELPVQWNGNPPFPCRWEISAILNPAGIVEQVQGLSAPTDDALIINTRNALLESRQRSRTQALILDNVTDVIITTNTDRLITSWNKVAEVLTGITEEKAKGRMILDILDKDYSPFSSQQVYEIVLREGIWKGEVTLTGSDGEKKYLIYTVSLLRNESGEYIGMIGVGKDLTAWRKLEEKYLFSELFYRNLISYSPDGIVLTDANSKVIYAAATVMKLLGFKPEHLLGKSIFDFVHPDDLGTAREAFGLEIAHNPIPQSLQIRLLDVKGSWDWYLVRGYNLLDNSNMGAFVIYFTNDSKRKNAEDQLRESERHFRELIFNLNAGIMIFSKDGEVLSSNIKAQQIMGIPESQMVGTHSGNPTWIVVDENEIPIPLDMHPPIIASQTKKPVRDRVIGLKGPHHHETIWLLVNADPTLDEYGNTQFVVTSFTDITEQHRLAGRLREQEMQKQKQITQAMIDGQEKERLEIGKELHDNISQHLTTTRLYMEVAMEKANKEVLEMVRLSHKALAAIIIEIRNLSQSLVPPTLGDLGLVESVQDLCDTLGTAHAFKVRFYRHHFVENGLPPNMKLMLFRIIQEQVNNIIRHAQATQVRIRLKSDAENVFLIISDNGKGFDTLNYKKGLGLSNIYNRASLFNGKMEIDASPGMGCVLMVTVPLPSSEN